MSIIQEINNSHISIKTISLSSFLLPFWYLSVFLFGNDFFKSADNFVILAFCLVIIFSSSVLFYIFIDKVNTDDQSKDRMINNMSVGVMLLSIWILILIFIIYSVKFFFEKEIYFYFFCVIYYIPIIILNLLSMVFDVKKNEVSKNKSNY